MFPNVRLMIVATFASILVLSCGFGVFAALRVSHEPLGRLPAVTAPLQLVAEYPAPASDTIAAGQPFGSRFQLSVTQIGAVAANVPALKPDRRDDAQPAGVAAVVEPDSEPIAEVAPQTAPQPQQLPVAAESVAVPAQDVAARDVPAQDAPAQDLAAKGLPAQDSSAQDLPAKDMPAQEARAPDAAQDVQQDVKNDAALDVKDVGGITETTGALPPAAPTATAATEAPADEAQPAKEIAPRPEIAPKEAKTAGTATPTKASRRIVVRRRVAAKVRRPRRARASAFAQSAVPTLAFPQPNFQSAPPPFGQQPVKVRRFARRTSTRKVVVKRAVARKTAIGGPFVLPPSH